MPIRNQPKPNQNPYLVDGDSHFICGSPVACQFPRVTLKNDVSSTFASSRFPGTSQALGGLIENPSQVSLLPEFPREASPKHAPARRVQGWMLNTEASAPLHRGARVTVRVHTQGLTGCLRPSGW